MNYVYTRKNLGIFVIKSHIFELLIQSVKGKVSTREVSTDNLQ